MYTIINGVVYYTWKTKRSTITQYVGLVQQYSMTMDDVNNQIIYQWENWNTETNSYDIDTTNNTPMLIDGISYTPTNGQVTIPVKTT